MQELYVNINGELRKGDEASICAGNRGHLYGDGIFESIRVVKGKAINVEAHIHRMFDGALALKMDLPSHFSVAYFSEKIDEIIEKSSIDQGGRIRISLDRKSGGTYMPISNEAEYLIEIYPLTSNCFSLNEKGLSIDLYQEMRKHKSKLGNYKTKNALIYVMCSIKAKEKELDELLITNPKGGILESSSSNLFVVSNGVLYTPSLDEGPVGGVMRMTIINVALQNGIKVYECSILPQNLLAADEVFLTNAISGLKWVKSYRGKNYSCELGNKLISLLNEKFC
jgi:branched-chain amino acid aminotransferase